MSGRHLCVDLTAEDADLLDRVLQMAQLASSDVETAERIRALAATLGQGDEPPEGCTLARMAIGGVAPGESLNIDGALDVGPSLRRLRDLVGGGRVLLAWEEAEQRFVYARAILQAEPSADAREVRELRHRLKQAEEREASAKATAEGATRQLRERIAAQKKAQEKLVDLKAGMWAEALLAEASIIAGGGEVARFLGRVERSVPFPFREAWNERRTAEGLPLARSLAELPRLGSLRALGRSLAEGEEVDGEEVDGDAT